jgi:hypothetical protein
VEIKSESDLTQGASLSRWVYTTLYSNRTSEWGKLLSILGVKYLIMRLDADMPSERGDLSVFSLANIPPEMINGHGLATFSLANTLETWGEQKSLQLVKNYSSILVYENTYSLPKMYQANDLSLIAGDRGTLISLSNMNFSFVQNPAAFLDDNIQLTNSLINDSQYIFFQGDPYWSLVASSMGENYLVKPWLYAPVSSNPWDKWVTGDLVWYMNRGDANVAPDGYIYTEGTTSIAIPLSAENSGNYRVLVQVYDGLPNSQGISFTIDNGINNVFKPTVSTDGSYKWLDLGSLNLNEQSALKISGLGGPSVVSKIAVIPESAIDEATQNVSKALKESTANVVYLFDDRAWNYNRSALITAPEANDGRLIALSNSSVETKFYVFNDGKYALNLTFQNPIEDVTVKVQVDNLVKEVKLVKNADIFSTEVEIRPIELSPGYHNITIKAVTGDARFNMAKLSNIADETEMPFHYSGNPDIPSYSMHSGSEYTVYPTSRYLTFLEACSGYWKLYGQSETTDGICIFNYGSLFPINNPGGQYTLEYLGLDYIKQGIIVAIAGTILAALVLKFLYPKRLTKWTPEN